MIPNLPHVVEWQEPTASTDRYGAVEVFEAPEEGWPEIRAWIQQTPDILQGELRDGRDTVVSVWRMFTNELGITAKGRIVWNGHTFEVDGEPNVTHTRRGPHHAEIRLRLVEG